MSFSLPRCRLVLPVIENVHIAKICNAQSAKRIIKNHTPKIGNPVSRLNSPEFSGQRKISLSPKLPKSFGQSFVSDLFTKSHDFATSHSRNIKSNAPTEHSQDTTADYSVNVKLCDSIMK